MIKKLLTYYLILTIVLISATLISATTALATTWYVDGDGGNDIADCGDIGDPCATASYLIDTSKTVVPDDIISFGAGISNEDSSIILPIRVDIVGPTVAGFTYANSFGSPLTATIKATAGGFTIIDAQSGSQGTDGSQTISYLKIDGNSAANDSGMKVFRRSNVTIHHMDFVDFGDHAISVSGAGGQTEPTTYASGITIHNVRGVNCSADQGAYNTGCIQVGGTDGTEIYYNDIDSSANGGFGYKLYHSESNNQNWVLNKSLLIHDNTFNAFKSGGDWNFAIESWHAGVDSKIYNNISHGTIDVHKAEKYGGTYSMEVFDNIVYGDSGEDYQGITIEAGTQNARVYGNHIYNRAVGILFAIAIAGDIGNIDVFQNTFYNNGGTGTPTHVVQFGKGPGGYMGTFNFWNNVWHCDDEDEGHAIAINSDVTYPETVPNLNIINNAFYKTGTPYGNVLQIVTFGTVTNATITNNVWLGYNNLNAGTITNPDISDNENAIPNLVLSGNKPDPYFRSTANDTVGDLRDEGFDVGLPYFGSAPDIGRYEYMPPGSPSLSGEGTSGGSMQ